MLDLPLEPGADLPTSRADLYNQVVDHELRYWGQVLTSGGGSPRRRPRSSGPEPRWR